jgi:hypothetical protein
MANQTMNAGKLIGFILVLILLIIIYYKKILKSNNGEIKGLKMLKQMFGLFIVVVLIYTTSITPKISSKFITLLALTLIINIYNINVSTKQCNFPTLYKINLFTKSSIRFILIASIIYYSLDNNILSFLYTDIDSSSTTTTDILDKIKIGGSSIPDYCPNMNNNDYKNEITKEGIKWKQLSNDERNKCSASYSEVNERTDISEKIYA